MATIKVQLQERSYPVLIGPNAIDKLRPQLKKHISTGRIFVFYDARFYALHHTAVKKVLADSGIVPIELVIADGEKAKSGKQLGKLYDYLLSERISRSDMLLACGGGVVSDLTGFAAATILRGIRWGIISTTVLGMVDAAVGGKTGINHPTGKNLIGAFWQPKFVCCDTNFLNTLPPRDMISGLGEIVKYAALSGKAMLDLVEKYLDGGDLYDQKLLTRMIRQSVSYKADIVSRDEHEGRLRMLLNFGHTFGHALENQLGYRKVRHGEAVTLGMSAAVKLSIFLKPGRAKGLAPFQQLLNRLISGIRPHAVEADVLVEAMKLDKKRNGNNLRFILLDRPGKPLIVSGVDRKLIYRATEEMLNEYHSLGGRHA